MATEACMLIASAGILFVLTQLQVVLAIRQHGMLTLMGNRDELSAPNNLLARVARAVSNHVEGMTLFAPLALVALALGVSNDHTVLGSQLFFGGRLVHAIVYVAGWPVIRSVAYMIGTVGLVLVAVGLL